MIYNQREGFDQDLSMIDYLKSNGAIGGNGKAFYVQGMDDFKFRMANVKEKMEASPEFKEYVYEKARVLMLSSISESSKITVIEQEPVPENIDEIILSEVQEQFVENVEAVSIDE